MSSQQKWRNLCADFAFQIHVIESAAEEEQVCSWGVVAFSCTLCTSMVVSKLQTNIAGCRSIETHTAVCIPNSFIQFRSREYRPEIDSRPKSPEIHPSTSSTQAVWQMNEMLDIELQYLWIIFWSLCFFSYCLVTWRFSLSFVCCRLQWLIRFVFAESEKLTRQKPHPPKPCNKSYNSMFYD